MPNYNHPSLTDPSMHGWHQIWDWEHGLRATDRGTPEALQEPVIDPVFILANAGGGAIENFGSGSIAKNLTKQFVEAYMNKDYDVAETIAGMISKTMMHPSLTKYVDALRGGVNAARQTLATEFLTAPTGSLGYGQIRTGNKPARAIDSFIRRASSGRVPEP